MTVVTIGRATLIHGDSLAVLPTLGPVDAVITDPPYSSGGRTMSERTRAPMEKYVKGGVKAAHNVDFPGDNMDARVWRMWVAEWMGQCHALMQPGGYMLCFTDWRQLPTLSDALQIGGFVWRGVVPWDKTESSRAPHKGYFRHQAEYVVWGTHGPCLVATHDGPYPGVIRQRVVYAEKRHMTAKPVALMEQLVRCVPPYGVVLDPFMGSGTTGVAALRAGQRFIGIEKSPHYFDVACQVIREAHEGTQ